MKRHFKILQTFIKFNLIGHLMYRGNFWSSFTADLAWASFVLFSTFFITTKVKQIGEWNSYELLLLASSSNILLGMISMIVKNFYQFSNTINQGKLDGILLKPVDSQFYMSLQYINISKLPRILLSFCVNIYLLHLLKVDITLLSTASFLFILMVGFIVMYSIWYIACTLIMWYSRLSNLTELLFEVTNMTKFPQEIFREFSLYIFVVLFPITIVITLPTKALLGRLLAGEIIPLIVCAVILFSISRIFWKFALRFYTSASS